jgi:hypothetical protein
MNQQLQEVIFAAACEHHRELIDAMPIDSTDREAYAEGLADGVAFVLNGKH